MKQVDLVLQECVKDPECATARQALADLLRADEDHDLAFAVESDGGGELVAEVGRASKQLKEPASVRLLWYVYRILPKVRPTATYREHVQPPAIIPAVDERNRRSVEELRRRYNERQTPWIDPDVTWTWGDHPDVTRTWNVNSNEDWFPPDGLTQTSGGG